MATPYSQYNMVNPYLNNQYQYQYWLQSQQQQPSWNHSSHNVSSGSAAANIPSASATSLMASVDYEPDMLQSRTLFFGRLPDDITDETLKALCEPHGDIRKAVAYPEKHMGFVEFYDLRHSETAREALKGHEMNGKKIEVQYSSPKKQDKDGNTGTLYVRPQGADKTYVDTNPVESYKALFARHGAVKKVSVNKRRESEKFVEYWDLRDATRALEELNGYSFNGVILEVFYSQNCSRSMNKESLRAKMKSGMPVDGGHGPWRGGASNSGYQQQQQWGPYAMNSYAGYGQWGSPYANYGYGAAAGAGAQIPSQAQQSSMVSGSHQHPTYHHQTAAPVSGVGSSMHQAAQISYGSSAASAGTGGGVQQHPQLYSPGGVAASWDLYQQHATAHQQQQVYLQQQQMLQQQQQQGQPNHQGNAHGQATASTVGGAYGVAVPGGVTSANGASGQQQHQRTSSAAHGVHALNGVYTQTHQPGSAAANGAAVWQSHAQASAAAGMQHASWSHQQISPQRQRNWNQAA